MEGFIAGLVCIISIIVLSVIGGGIRFRYLKKKSISKKDEEEQTNKEISNGGGFSTGSTELF